MNNKGFTMVELLVAMAIMGLLMIMAFPTMRVVQSNNQNKKFESYEQAVLSAAKLYTDSYSNDMFDPEKRNQYKIVYLSDIQKKGLIKDFSMSDTTCINGESNVTVVKYNNDYSYCLHLKCTQKKDISKVLYETKNIKGSCNSFEVANVTYQYKDLSKTFEVIDGDTISLLNPSEIGFEEEFQKDKVQFEEWNLGNIGRKIEVNGNTTITPKTHKYNYIIKYEKSNNSITGETEEKKCTVGEECKLRNNGFKYTGYTFEKWHQNDNSAEYDENADVKDKIGKSITKDNQEVKLTTKFRINKIYIIYNVNGGKLGDNHNPDYSKNNTGDIIKNNTNIIQKINYGEKLSSTGLVNINSTLKLEKKQGFIENNREWNCSSGCVKNIYNQKTQYAGSDFCDASNGDCTVRLKAYWAYNRKAYGWKYKSKNCSNSSDPRRSYYYREIKCKCRIDEKTGYFKELIDYDDVTPEYHPSQVAIIHYKNSKKGKKACNHDKADRAKYPINSYVDKICKNGQADADGIPYHGYRWYSGEPKPAGKKNVIYTRFSANKKTYSWYHLYTRLDDRISNGDSTSSKKKEACEKSCANVYGVNAETEGESEAEDDNQQIDDTNTDNDNTEDEEDD